MKSEWIERGTANKLLGFPDDGKLDVLSKKIKIRIKSVRAGFSGTRTLYNRRDVEAAAEMIAH